MRITDQVVVFDAAEAEDGDTPDTFQVYADPAGHPFCLCWVKAPGELAPMS